MVKFADAVAQFNQAKQAEVDSEVTERVERYVPNNENDRIPSDVWDLMQENGRLATTRLNELLQARKFSRLKASDQARLIALAQDRAYGKSDGGVKRQIRTTIDLSSKDATNQSLKELSNKAMLPEYSRSIDRRSKREREEEE